MQRLGKLLLSSFSLLASLPLGATSESRTIPSEGEHREVSEAALAGAPSEAASTGTAPAAADCWIVDQWIEEIHGVPNLCTKWACSDGRTWTD
ncbi:MAG TPA: hypothetical protein VFI25_01310 [Planctomycetota bacterium]|jgi:hypothetical protein|nr:hypothetical protein [Planctomycetota bacterium]